MDGVDGAADHAMGIGAGSAGSCDEKLVVAFTVPEESGDGGAVGMSAVLFDAAFGAFVAPRAQVEVEGEDAAAFVEALRNELGDKRIANGGGLHAAERNLDQAFAKRGKAGEHFQEIATVEAGQFNQSEGSAGRGADACGERFRELAACGLERLLEFLIQGIGRLGEVLGGEREQADFTKNSARTAGDDLGFFAMETEADPDVSESDKEHGVCGIALFKQGLAGFDPDEAEAFPEEIDNLGVFLLGKIPE